MQTHLPATGLGGLLLGLVILAAAVQPVQAETLRIGGTGASLATFRELALEFKRTRPGLEFSILPSLGSTGGIHAVAQGAIDVGLSARRPNPTEQQMSLAVRAYARTPFVVASRADNSESALSSAQLADIYRGKIASWPDGSPIRIVLRPSNDSSVDALRALGKEMPEALTVAAKRTGFKMAASDQDNADALEKLPGSLGGITLAQLISERRSLKVFRLDGVEPSVKSLAGRRYTHAQTLYLVTASAPLPTTRQFVDFVRSAAGAAILQKNGQIPFSD